MITPIKTRLWALLLLGHVAVAAGQSGTPDVPHKPQCTACKIELTKIRDYGSVDDSVLADFSVIPVMDSRGRLFAATRNRRTIVVFGADGKESRAFGRGGDGPGEFGSTGITHMVITRGDSLIVFQQARVQVFSPALRFVREFRLPSGLVTRVHPLSNGDLVVGATFRTEENIGYAYHVLAPDGTIRKSIGESALSRLATYSTRNSRYDLPPQPFVVSADERAVWIAGRYRVRRVPLDGSPVTGFNVVDVSWLPAPRESTVAGRSGQPTVIHVGGGTAEIAGTTKDGLVLVAGAPPAPGGLGPARVDVIDPNARVVLFSQTMGKWPQFLPGATQAITVNTDSDGIMTFSLWRVAIRGLSH
jgi:hypothetical protein